jgi:hypothetical protein
MELSNKLGVYLDLSIRLVKSKTPVIINDTSNKPLGVLVGVSYFKPEETLLVEVELSESHIVQTFRIEDIKPLLFSTKYMFIESGVSFENFEKDHLEKFGRPFPQDIDWEVFNSSIALFFWMFSHNIDVIGLVDIDLATSL